MTTLSFGEYIRGKRLALRAGDRRFSLRRLATRLGIQASYLSRLERGAAPALSEKHLQALAVELDENPDVLLALAGKIPSDVRQSLLARPGPFAALVRGLADRPDEELAICREVGPFLASFRETQRLARVGSFSRDLETGQDFWSEEFFHIFGLPADTLPPTFDNFLNLIHPDDRKTLQAVRQKLLGQTTPIPYTYRFLRQDGVWRHAKAVARAECDTTGRAVRIFGTVQDVTTERKALEDLRAMARFPEDNPHPVLRVNPAGQLAYANTAAGPLLDTLGFTVGQTVEAPLANTLAKAWTSGRHQECDIAVGDRLLGITVVPLAAGYANLYGRDITELRRTAEALAETEGRYRRLFDEARLGPFRSAEAGPRIRDARLQAHLRNLPLPILTFRLRDRELVLAEANKAAAALFRGRIGTCLEAPAGTIFDASPDVYLALWNAFESRCGGTRRLPFRPPGAAESGLFDMTFVFEAPDTVMLHAEDVTALTRANEALRRTETLVQGLRAECDTLHLMLDHLPCAVGLIAADGRILFRNQRFTELVAAGSEKIPGGKGRPAEGEPEDARAQTLRTEWQTALGGDSRRVLSMRLGDGRTRRLDFQPVLLADGRRVLTLSEVESEAEG